jgi:hypothetical protein
LTTLRSGVQGNLRKDHNVAAVPERTAAMASLQMVKERPLERIAERGVCAGLVGSAVMGLFAMVASATYQGRGFFTPMYHAAFTLDPQTMVASIAQAAAGERFYFVRESFLLGMITYVLVGGALGALFGVAARVLHLHGARALAGGVAYGIAVMGVMSLLVLPRVGAMSGAGDPIAHMGDEVGWPTFMAYFVLFGLTLGAWLHVRPQDIGEPRRATGRRRAAS